MCALAGHCLRPLLSPGPLFSRGGQPTPPGPQPSQTKPQSLDPFADLGDLSSGLQGNVCCRLCVPEGGSGPSAHVCALNPGPWDSVASQPMWGQLMPGPQLQCCAPPTCSLPQAQPMPHASHPQPDAHIGLSFWDRSPSGPCNCYLGLVSLASERGAGTFPSCLSSEGPVAFQVGTS